MRLSALVAGHAGTCLLRYCLLQARDDGKTSFQFFLLGYFPESYCWSHPSDPESFLGGSLVRIAVVERQGGGSTEGRLSRVCR